MPHDSCFEDERAETAVEGIGICICAHLEMLDSEDTAGSGDAPFNHVGLSFTQNCVPSELFVVKVGQVQCPDGSCDIIKSMCRSALPIRKDGIGQTRD